MYIALRPLKVDKRYMVGDQVPEEVIDPKAVNRLKLAGIIAEAGEVHPPSSASLEERSPVIPDKTAIDPEIQEDTHTEDTTDTTDEIEPEIEVLSKSKLEKMNRTQLVEYATTVNVEVTDDMVKREIIEAILAKRGE